MWLNGRFSILHRGKHCENVINQTSILSEYSDKSRNWQHSQIYFSSNIVEVHTVCRARSRSFRSGNAANSVIYRNIPIVLTFGSWYFHNVSPRVLCWTYYSTTSCFLLINMYHFHVEAFFALFQASEMVGNCCHPSANLCKVRKNPHCFIVAGAPMDGVHRL
jgi:hypothetical protein